MSNIISNILVGVDFSEDSTQALRYAAQAALLSGACLHVLHVHGNGLDLSEDTYAFGFNAEEYLQRLRQAAEQRSTALAELVEKEVTQPFGGKIQVVSHLQAGEPRAEILRYIEKLKPDLLIVASHGRGLLTRMLLGNVSAFLSQHSPIPTLIIPGRSRGNPTP